MNIKYATPEAFLITATLLILVFSAQTAIGVEEGDVIINEIAWMGTESSSSDEWIELYNKTGSEVDIENWSIGGAGSSDECLNFSDAEDFTTTIIEPYGYLVYGAHEDDVKDSSEKNMVDIWDATITLSNGSPEEVNLYDSSGCDGTPIDTVSQSDGDWFAGENPSDTSKRKTMERVSPCDPGTDSENWKTYDPDYGGDSLDAGENPLKGTPKADNSVFQNTEPTVEFTAPNSVEVGEKFQVNGGNSEDCESGIASYSWDLDGDGSYDEASGATGDYTPVESGELEVSLKVEDQFGKSNSMTKTVVVEGETNEAPEADPGGNYHCKPGGTITLDGSGSTDPDGTIESYEWDIDGDGAYDDATGAETDFNCNSSGSYEIGLKVTDDEGDSATGTATVEVTEDLRADFSFSPSDPVAGEEVSFTGETNSSEGTISSWEWAFDDGGSASMQNPSHTFSKVGTYAVTLTVTDGSGETNSHTSEVQVLSPVSVDAGSSRTVRLGESVKLEGNVSTEASESELTPSWEVSEKPTGGKAHIGDSSRLDPIFVPEVTGDYELKLTGTDSSGNNATDEVTVTVVEAPSVNQDQFAVEFIKQNDRTFEKRDEVSLEAEIKEVPESSRGSVIGHGLENWPEFDVQGRLPALFRDLKVTGLDNGTAEVRFYYKVDDLPEKAVEESLKMFYHLPDEGWVAPEDYVVHPDSNYVSGEIPVSDLKGTPLTLAGKGSSVEEEVVVHGPNPVPNSGCIFWFNMPEEVEGANLKIYDSAGEVLFEESLDADQKRFPKTGRWVPLNDYGSRLESGLYFYRVELVEAGEIYRSDVKKLVIGGLS